MAFDIPWWYPQWIPETVCIYLEQEDAFNDVKYEGSINVHNGSSSNYTLHPHQSRDTLIATIDRTFDWVYFLSVKIWNVFRDTSCENEYHAKIELSVLSKKSTLIPQLKYSDHRKLYLYSFWKSCLSSEDPHKIFYFLS